MKQVVPMPTAYRRPAARTWAAALTLSAAAIHFTVVPEHLAEYLPFGLFFIAVGAAQVALAVATVFAPSRRLFAGASAGILGVSAIWLLSRTLGVPIGPHPGVPEAVGLADVLCTATDLISVLVFTWLAARGPRARTRRIGAAVGAVPGLLVPAVVALVGVAAAATSVPPAFNASAVVPGRPATSITTLTAAPGPQAVRHFTLVAEQRTIQGQKLWTFGGTVPGPELRVRAGDRVTVTLVNHLPVSTTIHWHGVQIPNAEDGVAGLTQQAVPPGMTFGYEFIAGEAGTFWYHSHQNTSVQLEQGLFGALVVEPPAGVREVRDYSVMLQQTLPADTHLDAAPGETVRLRIINAIAPGMDGGPDEPVLLGASYRVVALDGRDLNQPGLLGPERIPLGMGQRADIVFTMPAAGEVRLARTTQHGAQSAVQRMFGSPPPPPVITIGSGPAPVNPRLESLPLFDAATYGVAAPDPVAAGPFDATYPVVLSKQPGIREGRPQLIHMINGRTSPDGVVFRVREGWRVRLHIVNNSDEYHPMHLHGHVLSVLDQDGRRIQGSPLHLDSVLVGPRQSVDVAFLADNPGLWMFHCHVLLHAEMGMSAMVAYDGYATPFDMGGRSGNMPE